MSVIGVDPPPCVIIDGGDIQIDSVEPIVAKYGKTILRTLEREPRWLSWDVLVSIGSPTRSLSGQLRAVQIGGEAIGSYVENYERGSKLHQLYRYVRPGHELVIPKGLSAARAEFVKRYLIPALPAKPFSRAVFDRPTIATDADWIPLLENVDGHAIAVIYHPHIEAREVWYLPEEAIDALDPVLHLAFEEWNTQDPKRFPSSPGWVSDVRWMSAQQQERIESVRTEIEKAQAEVARLTDVIAAGEVKLDELQRDTEQSPQRRLLTDHDSSLVDAVLHALTTLGFVVVDLDKQVTESEPKMGDLSVADDDWMAIAEVKGYTKGAKANDLLTVVRHRRVYEKQHRDVQRMWYVANSFRLDSPDSRPAILDGADEHVEVFGQDDGLALDTRDLFDLLKRVESGVLDPAAARETLKAPTGRFHLA